MQNTGADHRYQITFLDPDPVRIPTITGARSKFLNYLGPYSYRMGSIKGSLWLAELVPLYHIIEYAVIYPNPEMYGIDQDSYS
mgnify:CR=1 FL=1